MKNKIYLIMKRMIIFMIIINFNTIITLLAQDCNNNLSPISNFGVQNELNISKNYLAQNVITANQTYVFSFDTKFSANRDNVTKIVGVNFEENNQFFEEFSEVISSRDFRPYEIELTPSTGFDKVNVFAFKQDGDVAITVRNACLQLKTSNTNPDFCQNNLSPSTGFEIKQSSSERIDILNNDMIVGKKYLLSFDAKISTNNSEHKFAGINFNNNGAWIGEFRKDLNTTMKNYQIEFIVPSGFNNANVFAYKSNGNATVTMQNICLASLIEDVEPPITEVEPTNENCLNKKNNLKIDNATAWDGDFLELGHAIKSNHQYVLNFSARYTAAVEPGIKIAGINFKGGGNSIDFREHITTRDFKPYEIVFTAPDTISSANTFVWMNQMSGQTKVEINNICLREIPRSSSSQNSNVITLNNYPTPNANECGMYVGIASPINSDHINPRTNFNNTFHNCFNIIVPENGMKMGTLKTGLTHNNVTPVGPDVWNTIR